MSVSDLIAKIKSKDPAVRCAAWQEADQLGAEALGPLAAVMADPGADLEVALAAKHAMWTIVHHALAPGAAASQQPIVAGLVNLLGAENQPVMVRSEVLWMLSEIGGDESVDPIAKLLADGQLREAARCALERIPGKKSSAALRRALESGPADFKPALAQSLRARGETVEGVPPFKAAPVYKTAS